MQEMQAKPPYVTFEARPIEDREATIAAGHYVGKDVIYALVTPQGSKDRIEKVADDWLSDLQEAVNQDRFPMEWLRAYKGLYSDWKEGREMPVSGTAIINWPAISKSQADACLGANIRTVEDLAEANETALSYIGMGARALKERARAWVESAADTGKVAEELEKLRVQTATDKQTLEDLHKRVAELTKLVEKSAKDKSE
jgi:hypothetical protein